MTMKPRALLIASGVFLVASLSALSLFQGANLVIYEVEVRSNALNDAPTTELSPQNTTVEFGRLYSARACELNPGWGAFGVSIGNSSSCVGKMLANTNFSTTAANHLTCPNEKPTLTERPYPGITIALLYFAQPALLMRQLQEFGTYPMEIQQNLTVLVIDDGSPPGLRASDYIHNTTTSANDRPFRMRLARIETERNWNIGGARNLAFYLVDTPKTLLLDLDILVPKKAMEAAMLWPLFGNDGQQQLAHRFNRRRPDGRDHRHPAVCVIRTGAYWENGGCDEDFCGSYGFTDVHFWFRWKADKIRAMVDHLDVFLEEIDLAACDANFLGEKHTLCKEARSKQVRPDRNLKKNHALYKEKTKKGCWSNKYLRFRWILEI